MAAPYALSEEPTMTYETWLRLRHTEPESYDQLIEQLEQARDWYGEKRGAGA